MQAIEDIIMSKLGVMLFNGLLFIINLLVVMMIKGMRKTYDAHIADVKTCNKEFWQEINSLRERVARIEGRDESTKQGTN